MRLGTRTFHKTQNLLGVLGKTGMCSNLRYYLRFPWEEDISSPFTNLIDLEESNILNDVAFLKEANPTKLGDTRSTMITPSD